MTLIDIDNNCVCVFSGANDVVEAFNGNVAAIAENGIKISDDLPAYVPGKMDPGEAIYASAAQPEDGGCLILKSPKTMMFAVYEESPSAAARLAREVMDKIKELGY